LEEENADFFRAYNIRLKLKQQILLFNDLLEKQCQLMYPTPAEVPYTPMQNGFHHMPGKFFLKNFVESSKHVKLKKYCWYLNK
jgi:hypothetical protein